MRFEGRDLGSRHAATSALELRDVAVGYDGRFVLEGFDLDVVTGEFLVLVGPNGSGKSTILRTMAGLIAPWSGTVRIFGVDVTEVPARDRDVAVMYKGHGLFSQMTVAGNLDHYLKVAGLRDDAVARRRAELLELVRLTKREGQEVSQMSAGEQQRVNLARVLATGRRILLLHEPLAYVDFDLRGELLEMLREVQRADGLTVIMTTRDLHDAWSAADRIAVVREGHLDDLGEPRRVYMRPRTSYVARLTGPANLVPGHVLEVDPADGLVTVSTPLGALTCRGDELHAGDPVEVVIRPENIRSAGEGGGARGTIVSTRFRGNHWMHKVRVGEQDLWLLSFGASSPVPSPGDEVELLVEERACYAIGAAT